MRLFFKGLVVNNFNGSYYWVDLSDGMRVNTLLILVVSIILLWVSSDCFSGNLPGKVLLHNRFVLKTNIAALGFRVANIGAELPLNDHFTFNLPVYYSPYDWGTQYKLRTLTFQPEVRYWLSQIFDGHFVGAHGNICWFNTAMNGKTRYQDNKAVWGGGATYGYAWALGPHLGMEFTLGAGYAHISYDKYYNVPNGEKYGDDVWNYWGITNLGVNLIYRF